ncbi:MAG: hypothetical protein PHE79_03345 [Eubacteriales bacterium]|nr:hypothetical protein [Eubacteriales bacterium]
MDKNEVALKITLTAIDKGIYMYDGKNNETIGKSFAELYNAIYSTIQIDSAE